MPVETNQSAPVTQVPAIYRVRVGELLVTALSDGYVKGAEGILRNVDLDAAKALLHAARRSPPVVEINAFVVQHAGRTMLIDTGAGGYMGRNAGLLASNLAAAGIDNLAIDTVFLTHIHPDHIGGLTDRVEGKARFPNAELAVSADEYAYWMDDAMMQRASKDNRALFFECPREQLAPYRDRLRLFEDGEIFPGVTALKAPGHTPGHAMGLLSSGTETLLIWGDTVHVPEVQTAFPHAGVVFDVDSQGAADTRRRVFDMVAADRMPVMGMHLGFPGLMHLDRSGEGYRQMPMPWRHTL
jgi:glyoxylase-like metal-dependent hydrolase (beta-lactamase superfamily II)